MDKNSILIRIEIDSHLHQLEHLLRSQHEIKEALNSNPSDSDFSDAFAENISIMKNKVSKVIELTGILERIDSSFRLEQKKLDFLNTIASYNHYIQSQISSINRNEINPLNEQPIEIPVDSSSSLLNETSSSDSGMFL
jgi:ATP-dependent Lon protease